MYQGGLFGLVVLIADVWAIVNIFQSSADTGNKVLWIVIVFLLPLLGFILWYIWGPKTGRAYQAALERYARRRCGVSNIAAS